jgi:NAD+ synthase
MISPPRTVWPDVLVLPDPSETVRTVAAGLAREVHALRRRGAVVGLSGGVDSAVALGLCVQALGPRRVFAVMMPEADADPASLELAREVAEGWEVPYAVEDITATLAAVGCYRRRDEAVRRVIPEYGDGWTMKLVLPSVIDSDRYRLTSLVARAPDGRLETVRLPPREYLEVVAATSFKQRTRKMLEYFHADRLAYAVIGTPNRLEYDQGFFVKNGDGAADVKPIAHLYKSQVYQLAQALGVPGAIRRRPPTTDTFSLPQSQEEFYFSLPFASMDLCLYAVDHAIPPEAVAAALGLEVDQVERVFGDIGAKRRVSEYLHAAPRTVAH